MKIFWALSALILSLLLYLFSKKVKDGWLWAAAAGLSALAYAFPECRFYLPLFCFEFFSACFNKTLLKKNAFKSEEKTRRPYYAGLCFLLPLFHAFNLLTLLYLLLALFLAYAGQRLSFEKTELHRVRDDFAGRFFSMKERMRQMKDEEKHSSYLTRLDERNRISRSLHDVTGHSLSSALVQVGALKVMNQAEELEEPLERLHETLDWGMSEIRSALHDLYSDSFDLRTEIEKALARAENFTTELYCADTSELPFQLRLDLLSMCREAITNAVKYSDGDQLSVRLSLHAGFVSLNIHDNGSCTPEEAEAAEDERTYGIGLRSIQEMIRRYQGHMRVLRAPGKGFGLHLVIFRRSDI